MLTARGDMKKYVVTCYPRKPCKCDVIWKVLPCLSNQKFSCFLFVFNQDSFHTKLNNHHKNGVTRKRRQNANQKESIDEKFLKPVDLNLLKLQVKENHFAGKDIRSQLWKEKSWYWWCINFPVHTLEHYLQKQPLELFCKIRCS